VYRIAHSIFGKRSKSGTTLGVLMQPLDFELKGFKRSTIIANIAPGVAVWLWSPAQTAASGCANFTEGERHGWKVIDRRG